MVCRYFTHYWKNVTWDNLAIDRRGMPLNYAGGNLFRKRGVKVGDSVYVITVIEGKLFLGGRIDVTAVLDAPEAKRTLGVSRIWEANDHVIMTEAIARPFTPFNMVPDHATKQLFFQNRRGEVPLTFRGDGELDQQTLRGVRELAVSSAHLLDRYVQKELP